PRRQAKQHDARGRPAVVPHRARRYPSARILYSGGLGGLLPRGSGEAHIAAALIESFGVPARRLILEEESRTTAENAEFSRRLVMPKAGGRWLVVTSAYHMPRSIGAFRKAGV